MRIGRFTRGIRRGGFDTAAPDGREGPEAHSVTWERVQIPFISRPYDVWSGINARM